MKKTKRLKFQNKIFNAYINYGSIFSEPYLEITDDKNDTIYFQSSNTLKLSNIFESDKILKKILTNLYKDDSELHDLDNLN